MPIRREHRRLYPFDWKQLSATVRFGRAGGRCECCRRPHGRTVRHLGDGRWWDEDNGTWRNGRGRALRSLCPPGASPETGLAGQAVGRASAPAVRETRVALATAHLDHDPTNNRAANLRAFCQRCHMLHDRDEHRRRRQETLRRRKALGDLFLGPYPIAHEASGRPRPRRAPVTSRGRRTRDEAGPAESARDPGPA
ncbi:hypothetical protein A6302_00704 [Methylobrevis pamukkalensis]|uniref:Uncharacterized protein n=1 Tax=Methylobrevis pamukkalensis TaxID=1439726 RepID=A0A1E3H901_9HYPH|nr:hypothetical protein A6302_00704 [Methylobrevis pamukkalensis]